MFGAENFDPALRYSPPATATSIRMAGRGRQPLAGKNVRIYLLQIWLDLSDPQAEDAIYDSEATRRFAE